MSKVITKKRVIKVLAGAAIIAGVGKVIKRQNKKYRDVLEENKYLQDKFNDAFDDFMKENESLKERYEWKLNKIQDFATLMKTL